MFIADLHIHSKYSRATSKECIPEVLDMWARRKGIDVLGTGDFTHRAWRDELREKLQPAAEGLYSLKPEFRRLDQVAGETITPQFMISGEISSIYKKNGKVRKIHNVILLPSLEHADLIASRLEQIGNLHSDGRPILGLDSRNLLEIVLELCPQALLIPAHIWTPHFSLHGAYSGFDTIEECFEDLTPYIYALETGLSSDPPMNWRLSALDRFAMISNSDAHSPANLGREANIFATDCSYPGIFAALQSRSLDKFPATIEFFPEQGKYHYDGHRSCHVSWQPQQTIAANGICPVCGGRITVGVLHRVEALADRAEGFVPPSARKYESLVPLAEVIAASSGCSATSVKVKRKYESLLQSLGPELHILRQASLSDIEQAAGACIAEGVRRLRSSQLTINSGSDGEYGKVTILNPAEIEHFSGQICFFSTEAGVIPTVADPQPATAAINAAQLEQAAAVSIEPTIITDLNAQQLAAVTADNPAIAVIAGPGTGKTSTLIQRIKQLITQHNVLPAQITAVTFTNQAAATLRLRLESLLGKHVTKQLTIGTFHTICLQLLKRITNNNNFTIINEPDGLNILEALIAKHACSLTAKQAQQEISRCKNQLTIPATDTPLHNIYMDYCQQLKNYNALDYDDILLSAYELLATSAVNRATLTNFVQLLVDEFQDLNHLQYQLIKQWSQMASGLFIIGDPNQAIYGFRGADYRYFDQFITDFSAMVIKLTTNYRSTPEIISCATAILTPSPAGHLPVLEPIKASGGKVKLISSSDDFASAVKIAKTINIMVGGIDMLAAGSRRARRHNSDQLRSFADICLLYRTNRQAQMLEHCLKTEGIPYTVTARESFLNDPLVRQTIACFTFISQPDNIVALTSWLSGIISAPTDRTDFINHYLATGTGLAAFEQLATTTLPTTLAQAIMQQLQLYNQAKHLSPAQVLEAWMQHQPSPALERLLHIAIHHHDLPTLLQTLLLGRESDIVRSSGKQYIAGTVSLMTLHAAKGLEFPVVFLYGVNEGLLPLATSRQSIDQDEERRLLYVGMTRACEELLISTSAAPSPFLSALPLTAIIREHYSPTTPAKQTNLFTL